jgi:hypothetical protein
LPPYGHKTGTPQVLKMLGHIGDRQLCAFGQSLHTPLALSDEFKQLEPVLVPDRFRDSSELGVHRPFGVA